MKDIRKTIHIKATREEIFNALTNPLTIELWSGYEAGMEAVPGSEFYMFAGDITGRIISLEPPFALEQAWDFGDQEEESVVRIELFDEPGRTRVELSHTNIPDEAFENMETGWKEYYLGALKSYLEP
jgi:uncharacterized protein YndB with AHSA1/START domain